MRMSWGIAIVALLVSSSSLRAQFARQELHAFSSITISDTEFLKGKKDGDSVVLSGHLRLPKIGPERLPAIILLHGSGGLGGVGQPIEEWSRELNELGVATFAVDSFSGRGIIETITDQSRLGRLNMIVDAFRALDHLSKHRQIDSTRIAVMGFSRGGTSALYSSMTRFKKVYGPELQFSAHVAVSATCDTAYRADEEIDKPALLLHGVADNYIPIAPCRAYVNRLQKVGRDIQLLEYPDAQQFFDSPLFRELRQLPAAQVWKNCQTAEDENGVIMNRETGKPFSFTDQCVVKGATLAFNEAAAQEHGGMFAAFWLECLG